MLYKLAADFIVILHFLWIIFLIFGAFIGKKYKIVKYFHIGGLGFAIIIQIFEWYCPLTHLEVWLRYRHDPTTRYTGSFIIHYVEKIVYLGLSPVIIFVLTLILISISAYIYLRQKEKRLPRRPPSRTPL